MGIKEIKDKIYYTLAKLGIAFVFLFMAYLVLFQIGIFFALAYLGSSYQTPAGTAFNMVLVALSILLIYFPIWLWKKYQESREHLEPGRKDDVPKDQESTDSKRERERVKEAERLREKALRESEAREAEKRRKAAMEQRRKLVVGLDSAIRLVDLEPAENEEEKRRKARKMQVLQKAKSNLRVSLEILKEVRQAVNDAIKIAKARQVKGKESLETIRMLRKLREVLKTRIKDLQKMRIHAYAM